MTIIFKSMGVMNITPNSFSDGGGHLSPQAMQKTIGRFQNLDVHYLDIGAESTAPMNDPISFQEEWLRLQSCLNVLSEIKWQGVISLDSYRPKTAHSFFKELKILGYNENQFLWNDVSGKYDDEVLGFLDEYKEARYVFCHNLCPSREDASHHMDHVNEDQSLEEFFKELIAFFKGVQAQDRVVFDPCFGFSKTYEQNLYLLEHFPRLVREFSGHSWVYGISKKSFLRRWWSERIEEGNRPFLLEKSEFLHSYWLGRLMSDLRSQGQPESSQEVIFRVHDPSLIRFVDQVHK